MKKIVGMMFPFLAVFLLAGAQFASAENVEQENHSFTQPFQNSNVSLKGTAVRSTMYFTRIDYWDVKEVSFNLSYQITQLRDEQNSDLTVTVNGVTFFSWRPEKTNDIQQKTITIPLELVQDTNTLTIEGQIVNHSGNDAYNLIETPANWLTIYEGSNVNFQYDLVLPENTIHSFYNHFSGADTIANNQSVILVPENPSENELSAATYALTGVAKILTVSDSYLPIDSLSEKNDQPYQLIIGLYDKLPDIYKKQIDENGLDDKAVIEFFNSEDKHVLVVTSKDEELLIRSGRYIANHELMTQTESGRKEVTTDTETFTSTLEFDGNVPLTSTGNKLTGAYHQEQVYFVNLPVNRNNANGSSVTLHFSYANNLDFSSSLVTVYVNDTPIGSKKLTAAKANGDEVTLELPNNLSLANSFVIKVAFDLNVKNPEVLYNGQTPWAFIENPSKAFIKTQELDEMLFTNYPNMLIRNKSFADLAVLLPNTLDSNYFKALTNIFNQIGNYAESNVGEITYYDKKPDDAVLADHNLIILGTPKDNPMIKSLNDQLFFKYDEKFTTFVSNEKLSIEEEYGKKIGTAQLLFSPYNDQATALVVTGITPESVFLASTQLSAEKYTETFKGDAIVVDHNYGRFDYRFKKEVSQTDDENLVKRVINNQKMLIYTIVFFLSLLIIGLSLFFILRKNKEGSGDDE